MSGDQLILGLGDEVVIGYSTHEIASYWVEGDSLYMNVKGWAADHPYSVTVNPDSTVILHHLGETDPFDGTVFHVNESATGVGDTSSMQADLEDFLGSYTTDYLVDMWDGRRDYLTLDITKTISESTGAECIDWVFDNNEHQVSSDYWIEENTLFVRIADWDWEIVEEFVIDPDGTLEYHVLNEEDYPYNGNVFIRR